MKKVLIIIISIFSFSCSEKKTKEPEQRQIEKEVTWEVNEIFNEQYAINNKKSLDDWPTVMQTGLKKDKWHEYRNCYTETDPPRNSHKVTIKQGVWGDVWFWSGDFMPIGGLGKICQVNREVYVYELTTFSDVEKDGYGKSAFTSAINTKLVTIVESDNEGFFQIELEPGNYSIFVKEDGKFYSNSFDSNNGIFPVNINLDQVSEVRFDITYEATY